jgi:hypothetical protein
MAAAPPWWFWRFLLRNSSWLVPLRAGEEGRPHVVDPTRPTTAVAAFPGGVVPEDIP